MYRYNGTMQRAMVILSTFPDAEAAASAGRALVGERLAACVNIVPGLRSIYSWEGQVHDDAEVLAVIKTRPERYQALEERLVQIHPYDCPEVLALDVKEGHESYLDWVVERTTLPGK